MQRPAQGFDPGSPAWCKPPSPLPARLSVLVAALPGRERVCTCTGGARDRTVSVLSRGRLRYSETELLENSQPLLQLVLEDRANYLIGTFMQGFQVGMVNAESGAVNAERIWETSAWEVTYSMEILFFPVPSNYAYSCLWYHVS